jgi:ribosome-associated toxin RatA of RatAB toxin-antitoxin module
MVDGTFKAVEGEWQLKSVNSGRHCQVKYTLEVDPGPAIPRPIANMALKMTQKEIVGNFKQVVEKDIADGRFRTTEPQHLQCLSPKAKF